MRAALGAGVVLCFVVGCRKEYAGSEQLFVECMEEYGFEVTSVDLTPGKEDVQLAPHDRPVSEVIEATEACERRALGEEPEVMVTGNDLLSDVGSVVGEVENGGVVALVVRDGDASLAVAGTANGAGDPLTEDSRFNLASVSKVYTAAVVYRLHDRGRLSTSDLLSSHLSGPTLGSDATIRSLLGHTSGVANYTDNPAYLAAVLEDPDRVFTTSELLDYAAALPSSPPGTFAYSNTGYLLLGRLIEEVTGEELPDAFEAELFGPLGLTATTVVEPPAFPSDLVSGWVDPEALGLPASASLPVMPVPAALSGCQADCGVVASASDVETFFRALHDGSVLSEEALAQMQAPGPDPYEAHGLSIYDGGPSGRTTFGHGGGGAGYTARVAIEPVRGDLVVILGNNDALAVHALFDAYRP